MSLQMSPLPPPLPLTLIQALHRAAELHRADWSWPAIARAMAAYHGHNRTAGAWRGAVWYLGLEVPRRPLTPAKQAALLVLQEHNRNRPLNRNKEAT